MPAGCNCQLIVGEDEGILVDALFTPDFQSTLLRKMVEGEEINLDQSTISFSTTNKTDITNIESANFKTRIQTEDGFTSINYDNGYFLKIYRKVDPTTNP